MAFYWRTIVKGRLCDIESGELARIDMELLYGKFSAAEKMIQKALPGESKFTVKRVAENRLAIITSTIGDGLEMTHGKGQA